MYKPEFSLLGNGPKSEQARIDHIGHRLVLFLDHPLINRTTELFTDRKKPGCGGKYLPRRLAKPFRALEECIRRQTVIDSPMFGNNERNSIFFLHPQGYQTSSHRN